MNRVVLNVATGYYVRGQRRLRRAVSDPMMTWADAMPPGSPTHQTVPYAFKAWAILAAADAGRDLILWADASILPIRSLEPLWELIEEQGYWFSRNGWQNGEWCSDAALPLLGITRDEAMRQPHVVATAFGLNLRHETGAEFARKYLHYAKNGAFCGPWRNDRGEASSDTRVLGHRHDQTAASAIVAQLGMKLTDPPAWFAYRGGEIESTVLVADATY